MVNRIGRCRIPKVCRICVPQRRNIIRFSATAAVGTTIHTVAGLFANSFTPGFNRHRPFGPIMAQSCNILPFRVITTSTFVRVTIILAISNSTASFQAARLLRNPPCAISVAQRRDFFGLLVGRITLTALCCGTRGVATRFTLGCPLIRPNMPQRGNRPSFSSTAAMSTAIHAIPGFLTLSLTPRSHRLRPIGPIVAQRRDGGGFSIFTATTRSRTYTILAITGFLTFQFAARIRCCHPVTISITKCRHISILLMSRITLTLSDIFAFGITARISKSLPRIGPNVTQGRQIGSFVMVTALTLTVSLVISGSFTPRFNCGIPVTHQMTKGCNFTGFRTLTAAVIASVLATAAKIFMILGTIVNAICGICPPQ